MRLGMRLGLGLGLGGASVLFGLALLVVQLAHCTEGLLQPDDEFLNVIEAVVQH